MNRRCKQPSSMDHVLHVFLNFQLESTRTINMRIAQDANVFVYSYLQDNVSKPSQFSFSGKDMAPLFSL